MRLAIDNSLMDTFVAMPATVQTYHSDDQSATLQPVLQRVLRDKDGGRHLESLPLLPHVPVLLPGGAGFFVKFALQKGDTVLVVVCDRDVGPFISGGGQGTDSSTAVDDRVHALGGSVCIPVSFKQGAPGPFEHLAMGADTGRQIHVKDDSVSLGSENPSDFVVLAQKLVQAFNGHVHESAAPGLPTKTPTTPLTTGQVASSVVKSD